MDGLINSSFTLDEAKLIKAIPLSSLPQNNLLVRPLDSFGEYTVKSGYKMLSEEGSNEEAGHTTRGINKSIWKGIWKMFTPGKVKHFLWRACVDALPTKMNLVKGRILEEDICQFCAKEPETISHTLWECESLHQVWSTKFSWVDRSQVLRGPLYEHVALIQTKPQFLDRFATTAWSIWCRRNKARLNEPVLPLQKIAAEAHHYLVTYRSENSNIQQKQPRPRTRWHPPPLGRYKTNFDGAVFEELGEARIGVVIRNSTGEVMASLSEKIPFPSLVEAVEALAARRAARFVQEIGIAESILEGDSQSIISALRNGDRMNSTIGHLIKDMMSYVISIRSLSFSHVHRQGNKVAHALARRARFCSSYEVWMETVPPDISNLLLADLSSN